MPRDLAVRLDEGLHLVADLSGRRVDDLFKLLGAGLLALVVEPGCDPAERGDITAAPPEPHAAPIIISTMQTSNPSGIGDTVSADGR